MRMTVLAQARTCQNGVAGALLRPILLRPNLVFAVVLLADEINGDVFGGRYGWRVVVVAQLVVRRIKVDVFDFEEAGASSNS
jgi:hypothetical protein